MHTLNTRTRTLTLTHKHTHTVIHNMYVHTYIRQTYVGCENARQVLNVTFIEQTIVNEREELMEED